MSFVKKNYKIIIGGFVGLLLIFSIITQTSIKTDGYSVDKVYDNIKELSSDKYMGRRFGTPENMEAVKYIEEQFKSIGLKPGGEKDTYLKNYAEFSKVFNGVPILELLDSSGGVVKSYRYGEDFTENGRGFDTIGEVISGYNFLTVYANYNLEAASEDREIAILKNGTNSEQEKQQLYMKLKQAGYKSLIGVVKDDNNLSSISAGIGYRNLARTGYEVPVILIKESVCEEIEQYRNKNYRLRVKTVIDVKSMPVADVIGFIPGKGQDTLLITAHLDHVGESADGIVYPGALDNASGVSTMMEIARYIKSQDVKPIKNIVFIAFNAEEGGCLGSKIYVMDPLYPLDRTTVINLDMIGANKDIPLTLMSYDFYDYRRGRKIDPSSKLRYELTKLSEGLGTGVITENAMSSDHFYFNYRGVPAVTLIDKDVSRIHTPEDDMSNISKSNIDRALKLSLNYINLTAFSNGILSGNKLRFYEFLNFLKVLYPLFIVLIIIIGIYFVYYRKKYKNSTRAKLRFPKLTILAVIVLCGIISYLPIYYPYAPAPGQNALMLLFQGIVNIGRSVIFWPIYFGFLVAGAAVLFFTKHRIERWEYKGTGKEYNTMYYVSTMAIIAASIVGNYFLYGKDKYYPATPDFARGIIGKLILHIILGVIAYLIFRFAQIETGGKTKGYKSLTAFAIIFCILLSAFYTPITLNKYVIEKNLVEVYGGGDVLNIE